MGCEVVKKKMWKVCMVVLVLAAGGLNLWGGRVVQAEAEVPCYFIFGDSLVDNGNNNQISSLARADYMPYGTDFDGGPTGRFCNGKTTTDVIAQLLGFDDYIPPYATTRGQDLLKGVTFASAAAGIRDETGRHFGDRISMNRQVRNYQSVFSQIVEILGDEASAKDHLSKCIFTVGMGSNDYLNNYFMPLYYTTSQEYTPEQYADALIQEYTGQLKILYNYGARKVSLFGVGQIGCTPNDLAKNSPNGVTCVDRINVANQMFNNKLKALVNDFNNNLDGTKFTYINAYGIFEDMLKNPSAYGFTVTNTGCCGVGRNNSQITCLPLQTPCQNRNQYLFWDAFHPTEAANVIVGGRSYRAQSSSDAYPVDIQHLARL